MTKPRFSETQEGGILGFRAYRPRVKKEFPSYPEADAWVTAMGVGFSGDMESVWIIRDSGETTVTLEGAFAQHALDKECPVAPGGFRLAEVD